MSGISRRGLLAGLMGLAGGAVVAKLSPAMPLPDRPVMAILVSGGRLSEGDVDRLREYIETKRAGGTFHRILEIRPEEVSLRSNLRIELVELGSELVIRPVRIVELPCTSRV